MAPVPVANRNRGGANCGLYVFAYALLLGAIGFYFFNDLGEVRLPRPQGRYYFESNETQLVIAEAQKAAAQQQRLITGAQAVLLALQSSVSPSSPPADEQPEEASHASAIVRDNADLWKLALQSSLNVSDLSFPIDENGTRAQLTDYNVRALTAYNIALRASHEEEADIAEMIDYVQLFNKLWHALFDGAFRDEAPLQFLSQSQVDREWLEEWAEEDMRPSERRQQAQARTARRHARQAQGRTSGNNNNNNSSSTTTLADTLNLKLLDWLSTHPATEAQAGDIRRFLITQSRLWERRVRIRDQQRSDYAAQHRTASAAAAKSGGGDDRSSSSSSTTEDPTVEADEHARMSALLELTPDAWRAREHGAKVGVHVMLAADNGTYSGLHELHFIHAAMRFTTPLDFGNDCQSASFGFLERPRRDPLSLRVLDPAKDAHAIQYVPVLAVTTGIHVSRSAVCTAAVASLPMFTVKSMTFMGTAGVSPVVELGGWSPSSTAANLHAADRTIPSDTGSATTKTKVASPSSSTNTAGGGAEWSSSTTTTTTTTTTSTSTSGRRKARAAGTAWTRANVEAATNPECQAEWDLHVGLSTEEGEDARLRSPIFKHAPSVNYKHARETHERKVGLGSVCVTAAAVLQECGLCIEENPRPSLCSRPQCTMHTSNTFFGPCDFAQRAGKDIGDGYAENLKGAMYYQEFPPIPPIVQAGMREFWAAQEAVPEYTRVSLNDTVNGAVIADAVNVSYRYNRAAPESPLVLNCAEVDTSQILAGTRSDILCREYARALLFPVSAATSESLAAKLREMEAKLPLTCVQAMEGIGFLTVMTRQYPDVPVAIVRGASNYDAYPLTREVYTEVEDEADEKAGAAAEPFFQTRQQKKSSLTAVTTPPTAETRNASETVGSGLQKAVRRGTRGDASRTQFVRWVQNEHFMAPRDYDTYVRASYRYAIETTSSVVLNFFLKENTVLPGERSG